jgi:5-methylcytosine-specific restriction endonuclease McrA
MTDILPPFSTIKRKTPVKRVRAKARPGRLKGKAMTELRREVYYKAMGLCELRESKDCLGWAGWFTGHMHHIKHRSLGGKDELSNLLWACPPCHAEEHVPPKPCPKKPSDSTRIEG